MVHCVSVVYLDWGLEALKLKLLLRAASKLLRDGTAQHRIYQ